MASPVAYAVPISRVRDNGELGSLQVADVPSAGCDAGRSEQLACALGWDRGVWGHFTMHAILDAILTLGRGLLFLVEAIFNLIYALEALHDTGCGLRWLFSAEYRKTLREEPDAKIRSWKRASVAFGLVFVGGVTSLLGILVFQAML